ncbi:MAG: hypothetical protein P1V97_37260, partial [Planctomycetota bacterium]|nr:hypothetical protein [Planctomycetota bacterium]
MKLGQHYGKEAAKKFKGFNYKRYGNLTTLAAHKNRDLNRGLDEAERLSKLGMKCYEIAINAVKTMAPKQRHIHTRDVLLRMGQEAARKTLDWTQLKAFNEQLSNQSFPGPIAKHHLEAFRQINSPSCVALSGRFADSQLPLRVDFPFRAKTVMNVERGQRKKDLEIVLDVHSQRNYIGFPVNYERGAFEFEIDLETEFSAWELKIFFGLIPRNSTMPTQFDPDPEILKSHFSQAGSIHFGSSSIHEPERTDATFKILGSPRQNLKNQRGKWTFKYLFSPETKTVSLVVFDRRRQRVVSRYQSRVDYKLTSGRYLLGLTMGYVNGTSLRYHSIYPPYTYLRLGAVKLRGVKIQLDKADARDLQGMAQQAGGALIHGRKKEAIELYKRILDKEPRHFLARLHLAVLMDSVELYQE